MITAIRISGQVGLKKELVETLFRLRLRKKYTCVLLEETPEILGMLDRVRNLIAFGKIDEKTLNELIKARAKKLGKKNEKVSDSEKVTKEILSGKTLEELKIKPFFALHPPRKGIETKKHYPRGVIGNHGDKLKDLLERML